MKKQYRMTLSILLCMVLLIGLVPVVAQAALSINGDEFNEKLNYYATNVYKNGSTYTGGGQCFGFANDIAEYIFGSYPITWYGNKNSNWDFNFGASALNSLHVGDIVRFKYGTATDHEQDHSIFVTAISASMVTFSDGNFTRSDGKPNIVRHGATLSLATLSNFIEQTLDYKVDKNGKTILFGESKGFVAHYKGWNDSILLPPAAPSGLTGVRSGSANVQLTWTAVSGATSYEAQYSRPGVSWTTLDESPTSTNSLLAKGFSWNYDYVDFRVRAVNAGGASAWVEVRVQKNADAPCGWDHSAGGKHDGAWTYKTVQKSDGTYTAVCKNCGAEYVLPALDISTAGLYEFKAPSESPNDSNVNGIGTEPYKESCRSCGVEGSRVTVIGSVTNAYGNVWFKTDGNTYIYSGYLTKVTLPPPAAPTNLSASTNKNTYLLGETVTFVHAAQNATKYDVSVWYGDTLGAGLLVFQDGGYPADHTYKFTPEASGTYVATVRAKNDAGAMDSKSFTFHVVSPLLNAIANSDGTVTVTWTASDWDGYWVIYRNTEPTFTFSDANKIGWPSGTATTWNDTSAEPGVTYYYLAQAHTGAGRGFVKTNVVSVTTAAAEKPISVDAIAISRSALALKVGESETLTATVTPADATDKTVTWTSSNPAVAAVSNGIVTAVSEGTATITVTAGDVSASCVVTVGKKANDISGVCGTDLTWRFSEETGTLTVSGTGAMQDYEVLTDPDNTKYTAAPWGSYRNAIKAVVIETGVTCISANAFYGCAMTDATIPASVTSIGESAFSHCDSLITAVIPAGVNQIGRRVFYHCDSLTAVTIPASVAEIGLEAFGNCRVLTSLQVAADNPYFKSVDNVLFDKSGDTLLCCPAGRQGTYAIPAGTLRTGTYAFARCDGLTGVSVPASVTELGDYTFMFCRNLTDISLPASLTSISGRAFAYCYSLTGIALPESIKQIGEYAFYDCTGLTELSIPDKVSSIGEHALDGCSALTTVTVPAGMTAIGSGAFARSGLTDVYFDGSKTQWSAITIGSDNAPLIGAKMHCNTGNTQPADVHFPRVNVYHQDQFTDVKANQWFTPTVASAFELGLMKGSGATTFKPYGDVTIAEAVTMAARIHSIATTGSERFVQTGKWYQVYLDYAYQNGIIDYAYYNSDVTQKATRAQFAEIFANSLPAELLSAINSIADNAVPDVPMSAAYSGFVYRLYRAGILTGSDALGTFHPDTFITRAEAATIVSRMAESGNRVEFGL